MTDQVLSKGIVCQVPGEVFSSETVRDMGTFQVIRESKYRSVLGVVVQRETLTYGEFERPPFPVFVD